MKIKKGFRLDQLVVSRLEDIAISVGISQTDLIESLVNACYDSYAHCWEPGLGGFERLERSLKDRKKLATKE